jgi:hypothetical protein
MTDRERWPAEFLIADSARPMNQVGQAAGSRRSFIIVRVIGYRMGGGRLSPG